jgi:hypothetical protein
MFAEAGNSHQKAAAQARRTIQMVSPQPAHRECHHPIEAYPCQLALPDYRFTDWMNS